jgi:MFS transporter, ACS family, D-galactonate transporter
MQFVSGWLVDRFNASFVIAAGYLIWSLATSATGIVHGFVMLAVMRLLLGVGESVAFPCCSKLLAQHLPESSRGFANGKKFGLSRMRDEIAIQMLPNRPSAYKLAR